MLPEIDGFRNLPAAFFAALQSVLLCTALLWSGSPAMAYESAPQEDSLAVDFDVDVAPILKANCVPCHQTSDSEGGLNLATHKALMAGGDSGQAVDPGDASTSLLVHRADGTEGPLMPPDENEVGAKQLTTSQLRTIAAWINSGAKKPVAQRSTSDALSWSAVDAVHLPAYAIDSSNGGTFLVAGIGQQVHVIDAIKQQTITRLVAPKVQQRIERPAAALDLVRAVAISIDGKQIATGDYKTVRVWRRLEEESDQWQLHRTIGGLDSKSISGQVTALAFSHDAKRLAIGAGEASGSGLIALVDPQSGDFLKRSDTLHTDSVLALDFSPDSTQLASGSADKTARITNVNDFSESRLIEGHTHHVLDVAWHPTEPLLVSASADKSVKIWDLESNVDNKTITGFGKEVTSIAFIPGTTEVITTCGDGLIRVHQTSNQKISRTRKSNDGFLHASCILVSADKVGPSNSDKNETNVNGILATAGDNGNINLFSVKDGSPIATINLSPEGSAD